MLASIYSSRIIILCSKREMTNMERKQGELVSSPPRTTIRLLFEKYFRCFCGESRKKFNMQKVIKEVVDS